MLKLKEYLRIKQAAEFLGVSQNTLRAWGAAGKLSEYRHPVNDYRLYRIVDLQRLLREAARPAKPGKTKSTSRRPR
jgi:DNA (cytosine-5)-methyltransferase 1